MKKLTLLFLSFFSLLFYCANTSFAQIAIGNTVGSTPPTNDGNFILVPDNVPKYNGPICIGCELPEPEKPKNTTPSSPTNSIGIGTPANGIGIGTPEKPSNPTNSIGIPSNCIGCETPPAIIPPTIDSLEGYFTTPVNVQSGAINFILELNVNAENVYIKDMKKIYLWNHFTIQNASTVGKKIILTVEQFDGQRINVDCANYEVTMKAGNLVYVTTGGTMTNLNDIKGSFSIVGCPEKNENETQINENPNEKIKETQITQSGVYIALIDKDENGREYINMTALFYILGFISVALFIFYTVLYFSKKIFLGKK